ncbi:MAG: hypothetical protein COT74_06655 [Bdellovibrionales bacterium CG10_big_fil_rev_8_21_14_0_10_45_34]|nr:MAG: hypothetical protein COT74_06655 [Bdellovibrionales bacterium CG10_big_fil_rev_8_21_14_0_10_45_34]
MRHFTVILILATFAMPAFAVIEKSEGYLVKTNFKYRTGKKNVENAGELILSKDNKIWTTLVNAKEGFTVLGRITEVKNDTLYMEYIVVDANKTPNGVISTPQVVSKLGEAASIEVGNKNETISLELLATKTSYTN